MFLMSVFHLLVQFSLAFSFDILHFHCNPTQNVDREGTGPAAEPYLSLEGIDNELQGLGLDTLDTFLHYMVAVLVLNALQHVAVQLADNVALK